MNGILADIRFGLRQLAAKPGFAAAAILTLALGIGANTAVFSVLNGYLLKPLPYPQGSQLVEINESFPGAHASSPYAGVSVMNYVDIKRQVTALADAALYMKKDINLTAGGQTQRVTALYTRSSLFDVLRGRPYLGHFFGEANHQRGRGNVAILSYDFWQRTYGGNRDVIGRSLKLDGKPYRIVGVTSPGWHFPNRHVSIFVPWVFTAFQLHHCRECALPGSLIARTRPGVGLHTVEAQLARLQSHLMHEASAPLRAGLQKFHWSIVARPYKDVLVGNRAPLLLTLQGFVLLVLLMACVNVANLLLARVLGRTHEIAMRAALGASRAVLVRQLFVEGMCIAIPGGVIGVAVGWLGLGLVQNVGLSANLGIFTLTPDWRVGLFALGMMILVAIGISVLPIHQLSRNELQSLLQNGSRSIGGSRGAKRLRGALVAAEIALAAALLGGTGLLVNSFIHLLSVHPGFNTERVLTADILAPPTTNEHAEARGQYYEQLLRRVQALPGVIQVGLVNDVPVKNPPSGSAYSVPGFSPVGGRQPLGNYMEASPGYFKAMGIALLRGRLFGPREIAGSQPVIIIDQKLAERWFPHENPIGHQMTVGGFNGKDGEPRPLTIIGEVATVRPASLNRAPKRGTFYLSAAQHSQNTMSLVVKTTVPPYRLVQPLKSIVHDLDPRVSISGFMSMSDVLAQSLHEREAVMVLVLAFACIGLALAAVGVYSVSNYMAGQRTTECGVRLALGALPIDLLWLIIRDGLRILAAGLCIGLLLAVMLGYTISSQLFNVAPFDPVTLTGVAIALSVITLAACYLPARRAAKLDPAIAMMEQ